MFALTLVSLFFFSIFSVVRASPCIAMDIDFNLFVFGLNGKDYNAGTQDAWTTNTLATDITASGRPPFDGANTTCFLAQFFNSVYVLSADASDASAIYIYDATAKSWSKQEVVQSSGSSGLPAFNPVDFKAILDHDTNVFYALSGGEMFSLDMQSMTSASSKAMAWTDVGTPSFDTQGYDPVMALAENHVHFIDVPDSSDGQADIFVIHFSFFQPTPQSYPIIGGGSFPQQHGQTASFFKAQGVQTEFAFIPDDGTATYVINVDTNTTQSLQAPEQDAGAQYFAGINSLVQLDSQGQLFFLPYTPGNPSANKGVNWKSITNIPAPSSSSGSPSSGSPTAGTAGGSSGSQTQSGSSPSGTGQQHATEGPPSSGGARLAAGESASLTVVFAMVFAMTLVL